MLTVPSRTKTDTGRQPRPGMLMPDDANPLPGAQKERRGTPARRRVRGIAAQPVFTALLLMAANIRKIRAWRALTARDKARITRRARRRRTSLRDYLPDG